MLIKKKKVGELVLQSSRWGRNNSLLYCNCLPDVSRLLVLCGSSICCPCVGMQYVIVFFPDHTHIIIFFVAFIYLHGRDTITLFIEYFISYFERKCIGIWI